MWTQRYRARHAAHLKERGSWHAVQEVAHWLERAVSREDVKPREAEEGDRP